LAARTRRPPSPATPKSFPSKTFRSIPPRSPAPASSAPTPGTNAAANITYAGRARNEGKLALPVLFLHGAYDYTCETIDSRLAEPMCRDFADLTEVVVPAGHWMAQERPIEVNAALTKWLAVKVPEVWPT
jgi:pimeloyl-ACP methyl ester carboxylesterase